MKNTKLAQLSLIALFALVVSACNAQIEIIQPSSAAPDASNCSYPSACSHP